ncbi:glycosyltransferase family 4 protein [Streptomyces enissocaesilis]|uniref:D-inositol 3-phosphate glycosyltransferase n=1 Tax=Streptomyces enissocaesilis TaxID=332589 RepID=A0ABN3XGL8_9ACTN
MKIAFLIYNAYGIGGTIRSTVNLSGALAEAGHEVEVVSVYRTQETTSLQLGPGVRLRPLIEWRRDAPDYAGGSAGAAEPSAMFTDDGVQYGPLAPSRLTDERVTAYLRATDADVVIATRPILNGYLSRYGERRYLRIGQEHLTFDMHSDQLREDQNDALAGLDAFVTVSEADAARYRAALPQVSTRILCVPNSVPAPGVEPSTGDSRTIVAAGRLVGIKRYDRLLDAFAKIAPQHPDWSLRIYGRGPQKPFLRKRIDKLGLYDRVRLMGAVSPIEPEWAKGAIAAVSSDGESFGMTIVEAMHCGVPVVATDCPHGPGEIISDGRDGVLVPLEEGSDAFARALSALMQDAGRRGAMADAAREKAARYAPARVCARYLDLFDELRGPDGQVAPLGQRLRAAVTALRLPRRQAPRTTPRSAPWAPRAAAAATADGGIRFQVDVDGAPGGDLELLLRLRKDPDKRTVRLPLSPAGQATLERTAHTLAEGRWDAYIAPPRGKERRAAALTVEQARLLPLPLRAHEGTVSAWIPYPTEEGNLSVRTWLREGHAEVESVQVVDQAVHITGRLHGLEAGPDATVAATPRNGTATDGGFGRPLTPLPGNRFACTLPYPEALAGHTGEHTMWDLALHPAGHEPPVRLSRIAGDTVHRKKTDVLPATETRRPGPETVRLRPYFTVNNDLALSARTLPPEAAAQTAPSAGGAR